MRSLILLNVVGKVAAVLVFWTTPTAAVALWLIPDAILAYHVFAPNAQGLLRVHRRFTTPRQEVWLTIDDGPDPDDTPRILALLAKHGARATFFVVGKNAAAYPQLVKAIAQAGHEVANHTHTHPMADFWCASPARVARELDAATEALGAAGVTPRRFRAPVGIKNLWLGGALASRGLICIGWSARGLERRCKSPQEAAARATRGLAPGAVLLFHEGPRVPANLRVAAIQAALERLADLGYTSVVPLAHQLPD